MMDNTGGGHAAPTQKQQQAQLASFKHAAEVASHQVSHLAASHAADIVSHIANVHHNGHSAPPSIRAFVHGGPQHQPTEIGRALAKAIHAAMQDPANYQQPQAPGSSMWSLANALSSLQSVGGAAASPFGDAGGAVASPFESLYGQMPWNEDHSMDNATRDAQRRGSNGNQSIFGP